MFLQKLPAKSFSKHNVNVSIHAHIPPYFLWQQEFHVKPRIGATTLDIIIPRAWEALDDKSSIPPIFPYKMRSLLYNGVLFPIKWAVYYARGSLGFTPILSGIIQQALCRWTVETWCGKGKPRGGVRNSPRSLHTFLFALCFLCAMPSSFLIIVMSFISSLHTSRISRRSPQILSIIA